MTIAPVVVLTDYIIYTKAAIFHPCFISALIFTCFRITIAKYYKLHHQFRNTLYIHLSPFIYFKSLPHPPFNPCNVEHKHPVRISYAVLAHTNDAFRQPPSFSKTRRKPGEREESRSVARNQRVGRDEWTRSGSIVRFLRLRFVSVKRNNGFSAVDPHELRAK